MMDSSVEVVLAVCLFKKSQKRVSMQIEHNIRVAFSEKQDMTHQLF